MKISVIIPVYNASRFIASTIDSVLIQDEVAEVILVDDASNDDSAKIINELAQKDSRIKLFISKENKGSAHARNIGIKAATSELISFLDADDLYLRNRFLEAVSFLKSHPEIDGTYEDVLNIKLEDFRLAHFEHQDIIKTIHGIAPEKLFDYIAGERGDFFTIISLVIRRAMLEGIRFDENFKVGQDIEFSYQIAKQLRLVHLAKQISIHRQLHGDNITSSQNHKQFKDRYKLIIKWYDKLKKESFSKDSARSIFIRYIHHTYVENHFSSSHPLKWFIKLFYIIKEIIKSPNLIWKLI